MNAPNTPAEVVAAWERGEPVWTLEMGGLGPGYEQAIQITFIELLRAGVPPPEGPAWETWGDDVASACAKAGAADSGAQVGAAKWLAAMVFKHGLQGFLKLADEKGQSERKIMVSKHWPRSPREAHNHPPVMNCPGCES